MDATSELAHQLAESYLKFDDWNRAATRCGLDPTLIVLEGKSINVWSQILKATQTPERMRLLRVLISEEYPEFIPLVERYATEVECGRGIISELPELQSIELVDQDLETSKISRSLDFSDTLPTRLLIVSLAANAPTFDQLDGALVGQNTSAAKAHLAQFRAKLADELNALRRQQSAAESRVVELKSKIASIERAPLPNVPVAPDTRDVTDDDRRRFLNDRHTENLRNYEAALANYKSNHEELGPLRAEVKEVELGVNQLASEIAKQKARAQVEERPFLADVSHARDNDLALEVRRVLDKASAAFGEGRPFEGFWTVLGASSLFDRSEELIGQPAVASEIGRTFEKRGAALVQPIEEGLSEIARGCLAGPLAIKRALLANKETLLALTVRLAKLPLTQLDEGCRRADLLLGVPAPPVPDYPHLEVPAEIDSAKRNLIEIRSSMASYVGSLKAELNGEPLELRHEIVLAQTDVAKSMNEIGDIGAKNVEALERNRVLWELIRRGQNSANLPLSIRTLSAALLQEIARRLEGPIDDLIGAAASTNFALEDAKGLLRSHALTVYQTGREGIRGRLADTEASLEAIESKIAEIASRADRVAARYSRQLAVAAILSCIPFLDLAASLRVLLVLRRMKPLVTSNETAYVKLGKFSVATMTRALAASGLVAIVAAAVTATAYTSYPFELSHGALVSSAAVACLVSFAVSVCNLLTARRCLREQKRLFPDFAD